MRRSIADCVEADLDAYYNERCLHCGDPDCQGGSSTVESCMRLNLGIRSYTVLDDNGNDYDEDEDTYPRRYEIYVPDPAALRALKAFADRLGLDEPEQQFMKD